MLGVPRPKGRHGLFCDAYLVSQNASEAYKRAGYKTKNEASLNACSSQLLHSPKVSAYIDQENAKMARKSGITAERVVKELALLAFSNVDYFKVDPNGVVNLTPGAPKGAMRAVSSIKRRFNNDGTVDVELKLWDKPGSIRMAGEYVKLWDAAKTTANTTIVVVDPYATSKDPQK